LGRLSPLADAADADLASRAAAGDNGAFGELYRRHADAAWRVAQAVTHHADDAADAVSEAFTRVLKALPEGRLREGDNFRAYLLTATRRAGVDQLRRRSRQQPGDVATLADRPTSAGLPSEKLVQATDKALVAAAFRTLPERWRSVLWLTEVERIPAKEAAPLLGMSPNGVAQLAVRARNGLRERYIQAHLRSGEVAPACRFAVEHLGAYVAGALSPRDLAKVDQHLAGCEPCRMRQAELEDVGNRLRRVVLPLPLGLGAIALKHWRFSAGHSVAGRVAKTASWAAKAERPLAVMSAALFAAGIAGVGMVGDGPDRPRLDQSVGETATAPPQVSFEHVASLPDPRFGLDRPDDLSEERRLSIRRPGTQPGDGPAPHDPGPLPGHSDPGPTPIDPTPPPPPPPPPPGPTPTPTPDAQVRITVSGGGTGVSVAAGSGPGSCTGGTIGDQSAGCQPPPPNSDALLSVSTGGSAVPVHTDEEIGLP